MKTVGRNIRKHREKAKLSMADAAEQVGVNRATWWRWENDKFDLPLSRLTQISEVLLVTRETLTKI